MEWGKTTLMASAAKRFAPILGLFIVSQWMLDRSLCFSACPLSIAIEKVRQLFLLLFLKLGTENHCCSTDGDDIAIGHVDAVVVRENFVL